MPSIVSLIICVIVVMVLLRIEHKRNSLASHALWLPTLWMLFCGSRPIGAWFQDHSISSDANIEAGSPLDRLVLSILIIVALLILIRRKISWSSALRDNFWLILLFLYMGISVSLSEIPFVSFKRYFKAIGDILMAFVVLSEQRPLQALESILRRSAYVLLPFSLMLIKYFP